MDLLLEAALRSFGLGAAVWIGLRLVRVVNPRIELRVWVCVMLASTAMPALVGSSLVTLTLHEDPPAAAIPLPGAPDEQPMARSLRSGSAGAARVAAAVDQSGSAREIGQADTNRGVGAATSSSSAAPGVGAQLSAWRPNWRGLVFYLYVTVAAVLLLRISLGILFAVRLWRSAEIVHEPLAGGDVRVSPAVRSPVTFAGSVLLPLEYRDWEPVKLIAVLGHEHSHVRHLDFYTLLFATLHRAVFWINPLAWYLCYRVAALAEMRSDDEAIEGIGDRLAYAEVLLGVASNPAPPPHGMVALMHAIVAQRIERILDSDCVSERPALRKRIAIYGACCTLILLSAGRIGYGYLPLDVSWDEFTARRTSGAVRAVMVPPEQLDSYVGYYQADPAVLPDLVLTVTRDKQHLFVQRTGQNKIEVLPESERDFFYTDRSFELSFIGRAGARAIAMVLHQNGTHIRASRVSADVARRAADLLEQRLIEQARTRSPARIDPAAFDRLVGYYRENPRLHVEISRDGDRLFGRYSGSRRMELFAEDDLHFFFKDIDAQIAFVADADGHVNALTSHQDGRLWPAQRIAAPDRTVGQVEDAAASRNPGIAPEQAVILREPRSAETIAGFYQVDSFKILVISAENGRSFAQLGYQPKVEIEAARDGSYGDVGMSLRLRFTLDDAGKVSGAMLIRKGKTTRLPRISGLPQFAPQASRLDARLFDAEYAGNYQAGFDTLIRITREGDRLRVEKPGLVTGDEIEPVADRVFLCRATGKHFLFIRDPSASALNLVIFEPGVGATLATRIDGATARELEVEHIRRTAMRIDRVLAQTATAGSEEILRDTIAQLQRGEVDSTQLKQRFPQELRVRLLKAKRELQALGVLQQLRFAGVAADGLDVFDAQFAWGSARFRVLLDSDRTVKRLAFRWYGDDTPGAYVPCGAEIPTGEPAGALSIDVTLINHSEGPVNAYLVGPDGERRFQSSFEPDTRGEVATKLDRPIVITDKAGDCIGIVLPGRATRVTEVRGSENGAVLGAPLIHDTPDPQSQTRLLDYMAAVRDGRIDETMLTRSMARNGRERLAVWQRMLTDLGRFESLRFIGGDSAVGDRFRARFSNGELDWRIVTAADGRISSLAVGAD